MQQHNSVTVKKTLMLKINRNSIFSLVAGEELKTKQTLMKRYLGEVQYSMGASFSTSCSN